MGLWKNCSQTGWRGGGHSELRFDRLWLLWQVATSSKDRIHLSNEDSITNLAFGANIISFRYNLSVSIVVRNGLSSTEFCVPKSYPEYKSISKWFVMIGSGASGSDKLSMVSRWFFSMFQSASVNRVKLPHFSSCWESSLKRLERTGRRVRISAKVGQQFGIRIARSTWKLSFLVGEFLRRVGVYFSQGSIELSFPSYEVRPLIES